MARDVVVFDAYGTLFDWAAAAREAARESPELDKIWPELSAIWREKQIGYSWIRSLAGAHADFWTVTQEGLDFAMAALSLDDQDMRHRLLELYLELPAFPEAQETMRTLRDAGKRLAILSNGSPEMLERAAAAAGLRDLLDEVISVEEVGVYKPAPQVYALVEQRMGCAARDVLFVSSNGWDAAGASGHGFESIWVNRDGQAMERLPWRPAHVARDLTAVTKAALK